MSAMTQQGYSLDEEQDFTLTKAAVASPGGSDTQVQFNDAGTLAGDVGMTWDKTNNHLKVGGLITPATLALKEDGTNPVLVALDNSSNSIFFISGLGAPQINLGDCDGAFNGTKFVLNDGSSSVEFFGLIVSLGDIGSRGNAVTIKILDASKQIQLDCRSGGTVEVGAVGADTVLTVDDANSRVHSTKKIITDDATYLLDSGTATYWRWESISGVWAGTDTGSASLP